MASGYYATAGAGGQPGAQINSEILPKVQAVRPLLRLVMCRILNGLFLPISSGQKWPELRARLRAKGQEFNFLKLCLSAPP